MQKPIIAKPTMQLENIKSIRSVNDLQHRSSGETLQPTTMKMSKSVLDPTMEEENRDITLLSVRTADLDKTDETPDLSVGNRMSP